MFEYFIVQLIDTAGRRQFMIVESSQLIFEPGASFEKNARVYSWDHIGEEMYIVHGNSNFVHLVENYEEFCKEYLEEERQAAEILLQLNRQAVIFEEQAVCTKQESELNSENEVVENQVKLLNNEAQMLTKSLQKYKHKLLDEDIIYLKDHN